MELASFCLILSTLKCHSRSQFFQYDCVVLSCMSQGNSSSSWTVKRNTSYETSEPCHKWGIGRAHCSIQNAYPSDSGTYWCESERGERSNAVNIKVVKPLTNVPAVILEIPPHPVTEGEDVTLLCHYQEKNKKSSSDFEAHFYKDDVFIGTRPAGKMILKSVSKSNEGLYKCEHPVKQSAESWLAVRARSERLHPASPTSPPPPPHPPLMTPPRLACTILLVAFSLLILAVGVYVHRLWSRARAEEKKRDSDRIPPDGRFLLPAGGREVPSFRSK